MLEPRIAAVPDRSARRWGGAVFPLVVYATSRALVLAGAGIATFFRPGETAFQVLRMWDGGWWLMAATTGYPPAVPEVAGRATQSTLAFFPPYAYGIRALHNVLGISPMYAGLLISFVSGALLIVLLWRLAVRLGGIEVADRSVVLFAFFPLSFVLSLVYAESLMLVGCAACLLALLDRRWWLAGSIAAVTTAIRPTALALSVALGVAALFEWRRERSWRAASAPAAAAIMSLAGFVAVMGFFWARTGEPGVWFRVQRQGWGTKFDFGYQTLKSLGTFVVHPLRNVGPAVLGLTVVAAIVAFILLALSRQPAPLVAFGVATIALPFVSGNLTSPRFIFCALPVFPALAQRVRGQVYTVIVASGALLLALFIVVYGETIRGPLTLPP